MEALNINTNAEIVTNYNLDEEQEKKEIVRHYRALLRALREKLKKGDNLILAAFGGGFTWASAYVKWAYDPKK